MVSASNSFAPDLLKTINGPVINARIFQREENESSPYFQDVYLPTANHDIQMKCC